MTHFLDAIKAQGMINVIRLIEFVTKDFRFMFYQNILIIFFFSICKKWWQKLDLIKYGSFK